MNRRHLDSGEGRVRRILMTADTVGGVWTYALELCRSLQPYRVEVMLATMGKALDDSQRLDLQALPNVTVFESEYKLEWMEDPWRDVRASGEWLLEIEGATSPDIVHLNGYAHGSLPWSSPVLVTGHSCVYSWFEYVKGRRAPGKWKRYRREITGGLRAAELVTAPTRSMLHFLENHYGPFNGSGAIYNGRRSSEFRPGIKEPIILSAGRLWDEAKNMAALDIIASELSWPVYIAGEPNHPDGGSSSFSGIKMLGKLSPGLLSGWLGRASIYVLPARYEPFGLSALEAALAGCALVLGDIPSLREVWRDNALYVPPERPDLLLDTLEDLIRRPERIRLLSDRCRTRAYQFTPERMAGGYMNIYRRLLETGNNHRSVCECTTGSKGKSAGMPVV